MFFIELFVAYLLGLAGDNSFRTREFATSWLVAVSMTVDIQAQLEKAGKNYKDPERARRADYVARHFTWFGPYPRIVFVPGSYRRLGEVRDRVFDQYQAKDPERAAMMKLISELLEQGRSKRYCWLLLVATSLRETLDYGRLQLELGQYEYEHESH